MFHVRQSRGQRVPCVHRTNARRRRAPQGPGRARPEAVLLPPDDPLPRGTHRRSLAVRLSGPAAARPGCGEGFLGPQSFESFRRVRGVAWFERGDLRSSRSQEILPAWGAGDSGSNPDGPTYNPVRNLYLPSRRIPSAWFGSLRGAVRAWGMPLSGRIRRSTVGTGMLRGVLLSPPTSIFADSGMYAGRTTSGPRTSSS